jgi:lysozyme
MIIDISEYQNVTSYPQALASGVQGVIARATIGQAGLDKDFLYRTDAIPPLNVYFGQYTVIKPLEDPIKQADWFLENICHLKQISPWGDWEWTSADGQSEKEWTQLTAKERIDFFFAFQQEIRLNLKGFVPGIYTNPYFWNQYFEGLDITPYRLWIASDKKDTPLLPNKCTNWTLWQYGSGQVQGIDGDVDLNKVNDGVELASLVCQVP